MNTVFDRIFDIFDRYVISQINFSTLAILFCLMGVVEGFRKLGYVDRVAMYFTRFSDRIRLMEGMMIFSCFVFALFLTNDVALIVMVPFTMQLLEKMDREDLLIRMIVLETIAANIGGMGTPIGNPQNLYLYQYYDMQLAAFFKTVWPYIMAAILLLLVLIMGDKNGKTKGDKEVFPGKNQQQRDTTEQPIVVKTENPEKTDNYLKTDNSEKTGHTASKAKTVMYLLLFVLCILTVLGSISYMITFLAVTIAMFLFDRELLQQINYGLLFKFVVLFLLVGNIASIPFVRKQLQAVVVGREFLTGVLISQLISNVPAAVMLSRFTTNGELLLVAVDVGGLGTMIASMASMISFDFYLNKEGSRKGEYLVKFTGYNLLFMTVMVMVYLVF